jgi:post-segregation antitoxin (ccd killing protein)
MQLAMNDVLRKPALLSITDDVLYLQDKRKSELKSIVIPARFLPNIQAALSEIEYFLWQERNAKALAQSAAEVDYLSALEDVGHAL